MNNLKRANTMCAEPACAIPIKRILAPLFAIAAAIFLTGLLLPATSLAETVPGNPAMSSLIVKLAPGLSAGDQAAVIARNGGVEKSIVPALRLHVIEVATTEADQVLANYRADLQVVRAEPNKTRKSDAMPSDPLYPNQWALPKINWDLVFGSAAAPSASVVVAVLDTGIDATHPDLSGNVVPGTSILDGSDGLTDPSGHGTRVAGIVAARTNTLPAEGIAGVAYAGVRLMPVTVLNADGLGQDSDVIAGVIWAADHDADVILMAFSNPTFSESLQEAIDYAWSKDVLLVAAAGNDALSSPTFPAGDRGVIGVAATDANDQLAAFSNYGQSVFLAAPGTSILATDLGGVYSMTNGTSSSAAIVAGAAAQLWAFDPTLTNGIIVGRLARSADPAGTQDQTGNGRLNLAQAFLDRGIDFVEPAGAAPVGGGGPFVGPYRAAAEGASAAWNLLTTTISVNATGLTANKTYQISYEPSSGSPTFHGCFTGVSIASDSLILSGGYVTGTWTVRLDPYNNGNSGCTNSGSGQASRNNGTTASTVLVTAFSAANSTITGTSPILANGVAASTITITLKDSNNIAVSGVVPTFSATGTTNVFGLCSSTNVSGVSTCSLKSTTAEVKTLSIVTPVVKNGGLVTFTAAALDHIVISPASAAITAGGSQAYTATGFDSVNNSLGDVTAATTFTISPNGSCSGANCTATVAGAHTVTGNDSGKTATASLQVNAATLDHINISPSSATINAGGSQAYTTAGFDQYNNSLGDVTAATTFTISPNGSCTGANCAATATGAHTVTGTDSGKTATASLQVNAGTLDHISISPASATISAGGNQAYTTAGFDQYNNSLGDVTAATTFTVSPNGSCTGANCTATVAGTHTVTGNDSGKTATASLQVNAGTLDHIVISPASATITAGGSQAYTATGFDSANNSLGDVTAATTFTISPNGSCTGANCTATVAGAHTVTGADSGKTAIASLTVNAGALDHISITPASTSITAGGSKAYTTQAFDQYDNSLGDVTAATTFTISPDGSCTGATCTATVAGAHTVTGNDSGKATTASLQVNAGALDHLSLSPSSATIAAGGSQAYTSTGLDQYGNSLGDVTAATTFTIGPDGSCAVATCTATLSGAHTVTGTDAGKTGSATLTVTAGTLTNFLVEAADGGTIQPETAGTPFSIKITARDQFNNTVTSFAGTVQITSNGTLVGSPVASGAFVNGVLTTQSVTITSAQTGTTLTATGGGGNGTSNGFTVNSAGVNNFLIEAAGGGNIGAQTAGAPFDIWITARDQFNNTVVNFAGALNLATNAGTITPLTATFIGSESGVLAVTGVQVTLAGTNKHITATYGPDTGTSNDFTVNAGGIGNFLIEQASGGDIGPQTANTPFNIWITARDNFNNTVTNFTGTVTLSTDAGTITPTSVDFVVSDSGIHEATVTVSKGGTDKHITATFDADIGTSNPFTVNKASATVTLDAATLSQTYSGSPRMITATTAPPGLTVDITYNSSSTAPTNAGGYAVVATINDESYEGTASGTLTIAKADPTITWSNPADITYGTALTSTQLNAIANVPGTLVYTPPSGTVLNAGNGQNLKVDFTPTDTANYNTATKTVLINVQKGTPTITWANPADIAYPAALGATQLNATADVPGTIVYTPASGTVLSAGSGQSLKADFTPTDTANYNTASKTVLINVQKGAPIITWANPADITYPAALGAMQLNATANVPGAFVYTPASGTVLNAGSNQNLKVDFTPTDTANYNTASKTALISVQKGTPVITWSNPTDITYPTALSATQLNATANVPGAFVYTPASGTVLNAGNGQSLKADFTPTDTANYNTASKTALINVQKGTPIITWSNPADINYPTALSATQLNATANVPGAFVYTPSSGTVLNAGSGQSLKADFTPTDTANYNMATKTVQINVQKGTPLITWVNPADIAYPAALGATQLNATANVPGSFIYIPASGTVLGAGAGQNLKADFTPTDTANYNTATKTVQINVQKGTPLITWVNPADIAYPVALGATQLNATADVPGGFVYAPTSGTVLSAGNGQNLKADFTPTDTANYNPVTKTVQINVQRGTPVITWSNPADIAYPTALSATQLNATANVPGAFVYTPASGTVLGAGSGQSLKADFTPTDTANYNAVSKTVLISVQKGTPIIAWSNPADITYPTALSATQLNATADVPGSFVYTPASGTLLGAGAGQNLKVDFTPTDTGNYNTATKTVLIAVQKGAPVITWSNPADTTYPSALGATQLNATADVPGSFVYTPASGTVLGAGAGQNLKADFTPSDTANYNAATKTVQIAVQKGAPIITWSNPADITYPTALSATQLNATADVPGSFVYTPASGTLLGAGAGQNLKVDFTPTDTGNYNTATKTVLIAVQKGAPIITWSNPADIMYPAALGATQLNATANVPGSFVYTPASGTLLGAGSNQNLKADFTPTDTANYNNASKTVQINVNKGTPAIAWANPADITYAAALGATQLNATANVPGAFVYTPASGTVLNAGGNQNLKVDFTPGDTANYNAATRTVQINIQKAIPTVTVSGGPFVYDGLSHAGNCAATGVASAAVTGSCTFTYNGSATAPTNAGTYAVVASFTSSDGNYTNASGSGSITTNQRPVTVTADIKSKFLNSPNSPDPSLTYHITSGSLAVLSDSFSGALTRALGESVGAYLISKGTLALSANYALTFVGANLTILQVTVTGPVGPLAIGTAATVSATFANSGNQAATVCAFNWDDTTTTNGIPAALVGGNWTCSAPHTFAAAGVYEVKVTVTDANTGSTTVSFQYVVIYDANAGFVTGGGWINSPQGAYVANAALIGKANFGFVSKYQKGQTIPTGETQFQFSAAGFDFHSTAYDWLVIAGAKAQYKGSGTINGSGDYAFMLTATDGKVNGGGGVDKFRMKVWNKTTGVSIYDNAPGSDDIDTSNQMALGGGSITIHK